MNERLLQYIWQFQCFNRSSLVTEEGEALQVIHPGNYNSNQGPDFLNAKIKIGPTVWAGSIELHLKNSDWKKHRHSSDKNYKNVVLHVIWQKDTDLILPFQTLLMQERVSKLLLNRYRDLMEASAGIPCEKNIHLVNEFTWTSWKERLGVERLQAKTQMIFRYLKLHNYHWEECLWWMIAKNFGIKLNSEAFLAIAQSIPVNILAKHRKQIHQIEALLFGQAGLLDANFEEDYPKLLQREYRLLKNKYSLKPVQATLLFMRMRPGNFPSVRLAQLAMLIHESTHLFSTIRAARSLSAIRALLNITANDYWHYHYNFENPGAFKKKILGTQMAGNIIINTVIPIVFAYGAHQNEQEYKNKALNWLEELGPEKNAITKVFANLGIANKHASDSQALIQLKNEYCNKKLCLECAVGNKLINGV